MKTRKVEYIQFDLNIDEAEILMALVQNQQSDCESDKSRMLREMLFTALKSFLAT